MVTATSPRRAARDVHGRQALWWRPFRASGTASVALCTPSPSASLFPDTSPPQVSSPTSLVLGSFNPTRCYVGLSSPHWLPHVSQRGVTGLFTVNKQRSQIRRPLVCGRPRDREARLPGLGHRRLSLREKLQAHRAACLAPLWPGQLSSEKPAPLGKTKPNATQGLSPSLENGGFIAGAMASPSASTCSPLTGFMLIGPSEGKREASSHGP